MTARWLVGEAMSAMGRLRTAWPWLGEMRLPGRVIPVVRPPDERDLTRARMAEQWARDRHAAVEAIRAGRIPAGPRMDAARASILAARARIAVDVAMLTTRILTHLDAPTRARVLRPVGHTVTVACRRCSGTGQTPAPAWWPHDERPWPPPAPRRPAVDETDLEFSMHMHTTGAGPPIPCRYCRNGVVSLVVTFDQADALMVTSLAVLADVLPDVDDERVAADAMRTLDRAALLAHRVCGVDEDRRLLAAPCPACQRRTLYAEVSSIVRAEWTVRCAHPLCVCRGNGCTCGRPRQIRRGAKGRRHLWPAVEWDGPHGLAKRLGVDLPGTHAAPAAADGGADGPKLLDCACHLGGAYRPACTIPGGCGSAGCGCTERRQSA